MGVVRMALADAWARKRRLVGTTTAVLLGVAFLAATLVLGDTTRAGLAEVFTAANAGTDVVVRSENRLSTDTGVHQALLDASLADELRTVEGVAAAVPVVEAVGQVVGSDGNPVGGNGPPTIATGWIDDARLNPFRLVEGRPPSAHGEVVVDRATAAAGGLAVGDRTAVLTPAPVEVTVVGVAAFARDGGMAGATYAAFPADQAAELLLGEPGTATSVLLVAADGVEPTELARRVGDAVPAGVEAITGADRVAEQQSDVEEDFVGFLEAFLLVFAGVALLVAASSVHNTATILTAQRTRESALLRAVGASRSQVVAATLVEALVVGLVGAAAGLLAGIGLAAGLAALLEAADMGVPADGAVVAGSTVTWALVVGVTLSVLASLAPALRAGRVPPVAAMRSVAAGNDRPSRWRTVAGLGLVVAGAANVVAASSLAAAGLGSLLLVVGAILLGPVLARPAAAVLGAPLAAAGATGRLARDGAARNPRRMAGTASALLVGVGVVTTFTVLADSLASSIEETVEESFGGDLVVETAAFGGAGLAPELTAELAGLEEVEAVASLGDGVVEVDGDELDVTVSEPAALARVLDLGVLAGSLSGEDGDGGGGSLAVSASAGEDRGWAVGDRVEVTFADGTTADLRVGAVYDDRSVVGDVLLPASTWAAHTTQPAAFAALVDLGDGVDLATGRQAVEAVADRYGSPEVQDREEFVADQAAEVDQVLALVYGLLGLAIVIAMLGIAGTLSLSIHERTRELGLLRAVGLDRRQLRAVVRGEAVIVSLFGTAVGVALGVVAGWGLVRAAEAAEGLGTFSVPVGQLAVVLALGALVGALAAVRPARRAARTPLLAALSAP